MIRVTQVSESTFTVKGHGVHTAFIETVNALKKRPGVEVKVNSFGSTDITHVHTIGLYSLSFLLFNSGRKVVSAHIVPDSLIGSLIGAKFWLPLARVYLRWFYNRAHMVLAVSDSTKRELRAMGVKRPIKILYNMVDTDNYATSPQERARMRKKLKIADTAWVVVGNGQVQPRKRVDSFLAAARACPDMQFIWVGGMPFGKLAAENSAMKQMFVDAPGNVHLTGVIELEAVRQYYAAADVFWLPSSQETFGLVVVEAAASGLPVMLRDIPDYKETFGDCALMETDETFVTTLKRLRDDKTYYEHAAKRSANIAKKYGSERGVERLLELYGRAIASRQS